MPEDLDNSVAPDSRSDEDLDKLADSSESARNSERPMSEPAAKPEHASKNEEYEFEHSGKKIKGTREQILKWAQMGYDRPQFMQRINQDKAKWEQERQSWEKQWGVYKEIDDFAKSNADWWKYVQENWQNRGTQPQPTAGVPGQPGQDPYAPKFQQLEQKLSQFEQLATEIQQEKVFRKEQAEDQRLDQEIQSIRQQHSDQDWTNLDENGKSLETRVLEHAQKNGIPTFRAAFRDLLHDDLLMRATSQAKLAVAKGIQTKTKLGVLGESPTPQKWTPRNNKDIRKTSYEQLQAEAMEEVRQLTGK